MGAVRERHALKQARPLTVDVDAFMKDAARLGGDPFGLTIRSVNNMGVSETMASGSARVSTASYTTASAVPRA